MEPTTMIAIAQLANSMLNKPKGGDPTGLLIQMLASIQKELSVINKKLDVLYDEVKKIPNAIKHELDLELYKRAIPQACEILSVYANLLQKHGAIKAQTIFEENGRDNLLDQRSKLRDGFNSLRENLDPVSINYVCVGILIDYKISKLIEEDEEFAKSRANIYINYLEDILYDNGNGSYNDIISTVQSEISNFSPIVYEREHYVRYEWGVVQRIGSGDGYEKYGYKEVTNRHKYFEWRPKFSNRNLDKHTDKTVKLLFDLGYLKSQELSVLDDYDVHDSEKSDYLDGKIKCQTTRKKKVGGSEDEDKKKACDVISIEKEQDSKLYLKQLHLLSLFSAYENATATLRNSIKHLASYE